MCDERTILLNTMGNCRKDIIDKYAGSKGKVEVISFFVELVHSVFIYLTLLSAHKYIEKVENFEIILSVLPNISW